jgi:hypothetical protein
MSPVTCRLVCVGGLCALAAGMLWVGSRSLLELRPGDTSLGVFGRQMAEEIRRGEQLDAAGPIIMHGLERKSEIARELIAGRLTLFEAAARFKAVNAARPANLPPILDPYPGATYEERLCRQVIVFADTELEGSYDRAEFVARLEADLQEHLDRHGTVVLPEVPPE